MLRLHIQKSHIFTILALTAVLLSLFTAVVQAQETAPTITDDDVNRIAKQMFCPVCENVPLDVCPTQACHQWRETIRLMLAEGKSEQEIKDYFVQQYGDRVLAAPPRRGFNWLVYIVPVLLVGAGIVFFFVISSKWQSASVKPAAAPPTIEEDEYVKQLEEELKRR